MLPYLTALLPVLLLLATVFIFAGVTAGSNADEISRNENVSHLWESRERLVALLGAAVLAFTGELVGAGGPRPYISIVLGFAAAILLFGLRFDIRLNLRRGLDRYYLGTDPQTASTDQAVRAHGLSGRQFAALKLAGLLLLVAALVWLRLP